MAFCIRCGKPCAEGETMCDDCKAWFQEKTGVPSGAPGNASLQQPTVNPAGASAPAPQQTPSQPEKKSKSGIIIAVLAVIIIALVIGLFVVLNKKDGDSDKAQTAAEQPAQTEQKEAVEKDDAEEQKAAEEKAAEEKAAAEAAAKEEAAKAEAQKAQEQTPTYAPISMSNIVSAEASSILPTSSSGTYGPENIYDGQLVNAWVEGISGQGIGETITLRFDNTYYINGLDINAGYQKSTDLYFKNSRPEQIRLVFSDGYSQVFTLKDVCETQRLELEAPVASDSISLCIESVYAGSKYEDTAISEISLY